MNATNVNQTDFASKAYERVVRAQVRRNPCLQNLVEFFNRDSASQHACRIVCLEFSGPSTPRVKNLDFMGLWSLLHNPEKDDRNLLGRLLIVEDLSKDVIETLGSALDIDPFFFASQTDSVESQTTTGRPRAATLPSRAKSQNFLTLDYHRVMEFEGVGRRLLVRGTNVRRKVKILPAIKGASIGLARHCCSILQTVEKNGLWLGIVLVDVPTCNSYTTGYQDGDKATTIIAQSQPFQGGFEDFLPSSPSQDLSINAACPERRSLLEDLLHYWSDSLPPGFNTQCPTLQSLAYYPLKTIAAEWMLYTEVMYHSIKQHERSPSTLPAAFEQVAALNADLSALQKWARRSMASSHKIRQVLGFLRSHGVLDQNPECGASLIADYEYIALNIDTYACQLKDMVPIVTSLIQILDTQRSLAETANITRLTYLALVFVPLTFVSSLLSMNDAFAPGGKIFWLYSLTAIPVSVFVFLIARPPARIHDLLPAWIWQRKKLR